MPSTTVANAPAASSVDCSSEDRSTVDRKGEGYPKACPCTKCNPNGCGSGAEVATGVYLEMPDAG
ncbi:Phosphatidylinositol 3,4,5-trisphosphate-dependent Rac exchanger 2 protein [Hypoxylon texense]